MRTVVRLCLHPALLALLISALVAIALIAPGRSSAQVPSPIDPDNGESTLLDLVNSLPINDIESALNNFPVPYVVVAQAGGADPVIITKKAGSPVRIDADRSKSTGKGGSGQDLIVEVNTELFPTPHLNLTIDRLGNAPFASDLTVVVAFPFDAFNTEDGTAGGESPNLFFGFETTAAFDASSGNYPAGGHAPLRVSYDITPGILAGTNHLFDLTTTTTGADNPIRFLAGHFDGAPGSTPQDAIAMGYLADPVPATINLGLDINASAIASGGATTGSFGIDWSASAPTKVIFDYIENEDFPFTVADYGTTVTFDQMPTQESLDIDVDYPNQTLGITHAANAVVGELTIHHRRNDGLDVRAVASDVPTQVDVDLDFNGSVVVDVNANTMDFALTATQEGGFPGSDAFFGYPMSFLYVAATDIPDMSASYDAANAAFNVSATNPGESIGSIAFIMDDDATALRDENGDLSPELQLPPDQGPLGTGVGIPWDDANRHIFSLVDDGTHGTAAARINLVKSATLDLDSPDLENIGESYTLDLAEPANPLTAYLALAPTSSFSSGNDILATCNVHDFPHGVTTFDIDLPPQKLSVKYTTNPSQTIDEVFCSGHVNSLNFELLASDLPGGLVFDFDPAGSLHVEATTGQPSFDPAFIGALAMRLWDEDVAGNPNGLGAGTAALLGAPLRDARVRVDKMPSFDGTWSDATGSTSVAFNTAAAPPSEFAYTDGIQVAVSTAVDLTTALPAGDGTQDHYLTLIDQGSDGGGNPLPKQLTAGAFGIDSVSYGSTDTGGARTLSASYSANQDHRLVATIDSAFGGRFFPDYDIDVQAIIDDVPQTWSFSTDLALKLDYTGSDGIASITAEGDIDDTNDGTDNPTHVNIALTGLPAEVHYALDPSLEGSASLSMSGPITGILVELTSDTGVFGKPYKHVLFDIDTIPANWTAEWGLTPNPHASLTADQPLGAVSVILSRDVAANTPTKYQPFQAAGGAVGYSAFTREIDRRYFTQGSGDDATRQTVYMTRLDDLFGRTAQLDSGEDHVIYRENSDGQLDFLSIQGTGFQGVSAALSTSVTASVNIPFAGDHPFYIGLQDKAGKFTVVQIENIPDTTTVDVSTSHANVDFASAPGDILVYQGPLPAAGDGDNVLKVLVLDAPSFIHANWILGFPGGITIDTSNPTEVRLLTQNGGTRTLADFAVGDLSATWGFNSGSTTEKCQLDPPGCGEYLTIAQVFFDFTANPALEGFLMSYDRIGSPMGLTGGCETSPCPAPGGSEYVPRYSALLEGFSQFDVSVEAEICLIGVCPIAVPTVGTTIDQDLLGSVNFDWWDLGGGFLDFFGDPDYINNDPWDFWPVFHAQDDHLFPFSP